MDHATTIREFLVDKFLYGNDAQLTTSTSLVESGVIDSTGILELVAFVEETFHIPVADDEIVPENFDSIDRLAAFVASKKV